MLRLLESADTFEALTSQAGYHWFLARLQPARTTAA